MEDTSPNATELATNHSDSYSHEMDDPSFLKELPQYTPDADIGLERFELNDTPRSTGAARNSEVSSSNIGDQFNSTYHYTELLDQTLVSPISANRYPFDCHLTPIETSLDTAAGWVSPTSSHANTSPSSEVFLENGGHVIVSPTLSESLPSPKDKKNICDVVTPSSQMHVEELREVVRVLNEEWMRRCQTTPDLILHPALPPKYLFELGVQTLQQIYQSILPQTVEAIFALAHITCASIHIIHGADKSYCWSDFFQNILRWQHSLPNKSDAQLYIRLVNLMSSPQGPSATFSCGQGTHVTLLPLRSPALTFDTSSSSETEDLQPLQGPKTPDSISVLNLLKEGSGLRECSILLDRMAYAGILERNKQHPSHLSWYALTHITNIEEMLKKIIHPLQKCRGIEALHATIEHTTTELRNGSLRSVREVEVSLISNVNSSCLSPHLYQRYLHAVTHICDRAMHEAGLSWRDPYYATHLDMVLASALEMDKRKRPAQIVPCLDRKIDINAMLHTERSPAISVSEVASSEIQTPTDSSPCTLTSSPYTLTSPSFTNGSSPTTQPSAVTSPQTTFSGSSPSSSGDVSYCPYCPTTFTGTPRNRSSNLKRHMRTTRDHGNAVGLQCGVKGCSTVISRTDNLAKHMRTVHGDNTDATKTTFGRKGTGKRRTDEDTAGRSA